MPVAGDGLLASHNPELGTPAEPAGALYFEAIGRLREEARDEIDRLIRFLDETENHISRDDEDGADDEPSLGWPEGQTGGFRWGSTDDCEAELEHDEDDGLAEPSLGNLGDHHPNQERWAADSRRDLERDDAESGIADYDGLLERVGSQDWQKGGMA